MFLVYGGKHSKEKTPTTQRIYSIVWGHHCSGNTECQSSLVNILVCDVGNLKVRHVYSLKDSSIQTFQITYMSLLLRERLVFLSAPLNIANH
jgi:hypothetical protein